MIHTIQIKAYEIGLVFKNNRLERLLQEGSHYLFGFYEIEVVSTLKPYNPSIDINVLMEHNEFASMLHVIEVGDAEIVLKFQNNQLKEVLTTGIYAYWKRNLQFEFKKYSLIDFNIPDEITTTLLEHRFLAPFIRKYQVENFQEGALFINNKLEGTLNPGVYYWWKNATPIHVGVIDMRILQLEISGQELLTKDKAALRINFNTRYKVVDIIKALTENKEYEKQLYLMIQFALRDTIGAYTLDEILSKKELLATEISELLVTKTREIGIKIIDAGIKDIILPGEMKDILNQVLIAEKKAQANSIMRREETAAMRSMLNTAKLMEENDMLWKLKEMEYVEKVAEKVGQITIAGNGNVLGQLKEIFSR